LANIIFPGKLYVGKESFACMKQSLALLLLLFVLSACGGTTAEPVAPSPQAVEMTEIPAPTAVPTPTSAPAAPSTVIAAEATKTVEATTPTVETAAELPELEAEVGAADEPDWLTVEGKTDEGLTYLGNPNAPITILDYSDFL
jgi:protein-disulfide isomerase